MKRMSTLFKKILVTALAVSLIGGTIFSGTAVNAKAITQAGSIARGIDVSRYNGTINWAQVKASGIKFAFIRIGNTYGGLDPMAYYNIQQAQANGIQVGVYLYSYATTVEAATTEAMLTIQWLQNFGLQLPVVFDIEDKCHTALDPMTLANIINTYCILVDAAGFYPMVYTYKNFYQGKIGTSPWDKWMAQYGDSLNFGESVAFWQYSSHGSVPGVPTRVDLDYQYKDYSKLIIGEGFLPHNGTTRFYRNYRMQTGWIDYQNNRYYADALGNVQKGWFFDTDGALYFFDTTTGAMTTGLADIQGFTFFFNEKGIRQIGMIDYGAGMRYFDPTMTGAMAKSWFAYENRMHYADPDGTLAIGLKEIDGNLYYFDETGGLVLNDTIVIGDKQYVAAENGVLTEVPPIDPAFIDPVTGYYLDITTGNWIDLTTGAVVLTAEEAAAQAAAAAAATAQATATPVMP